MLRTGAIGNLRKVTSRSRLWPRVLGIGAVVGIAALWVIPVGGETVGSVFFSSLRLAKPKPDTAGTALNAPLNGGRRLQALLAAIVAESTVTVRDDANQSVTSAAAAEKTLSFRPRLLTGRSDIPSVFILGAQRIEAAVNPSQLRTLLVQAGHRDASVQPALAHAAVSFEAARGVRVQYGNCPAPIANTIQGQIQGPPPPSTDNASCIAINQVPIASMRVPPALDTSAVMELALEVAGMSPKQAGDFRRVFPWPAAAVIAPPRGVRSYEVVRVGDTDGMLVITSGRRGPTYALSWVRDGIVFTLTGYGSSADAEPLARSLE